MKIKRLLKYLAVFAFWLCVWQAVALIVHEELLFPSPLSTGKELCRLAVTASFWKTVGVSFSRIFIGILTAIAVGILGGTVTAVSKFADTLFSPVLSVIRSTPVASFIILLVLWLNRSTVPSVIAALMVVPVLWESVKTGIRQTDVQLTETAKVFRFSPAKTVRYLYIPSVYPFFLSAIRASLGLAWKAGVAAEVIVLPVLSIGRQLYDASNNLKTAEMFAWTVAVILLSVTVDGSMRLLMKQAERVNRRRKGVSAA